MQHRDHSVVAVFAQNGIGREGGDGSAERGRSVTYDCLVTLEAERGHTCAFVRYEVIYTRSSTERI